MPEGGIDRRALIKGAAAATAGAWVAPAIIDSLASPAAAVTVAGGCFHFRVNPSSCATSTTIGTGGACPATTTACSPITAVASGTNYNTQYCITASSCLATTNTVTFTIGAGCPTCVFRAGNAQTNASGCTQCIAGTIGGAGKTMTFTKPAGSCQWNSWSIIVQCT